MRTISPRTVLLAMFLFTNWIGQSVLGPFALFGFFFFPYGTLAFTISGKNIDPLSFIFICCFMYIDFANLSNFVNKHVVHEN